MDPFGLEAGSSRAGRTPGALIALGARLSIGSPVAAPAPLTARSARFGPVGAGVTPVAGAPPGPVGAAGLAIGAVPATVLGIAISATRAAAAPVLLVAAPPPVTLVAAAPVLLVAAPPPVTLVAAAPVLLVAAPPPVTLVAAAPVLLVAAPPPVTLAAPPPVTLVAAAPVPGAAAAPVLLVAAAPPLARGGCAVPPGVPVGVAVAAGSRHERGGHQRAGTAAYQLEPSGRLRTSPGGEQRGYLQTVQPAVHFGLQNRADCCCIGDQVAGDLALGSSRPGGPPGPGAVVALAGEFYLDSSRHGQQSYTARQRV